MTSNLIKSIYATFLILALTSFSPLKGQSDEVLIYGTITTIEDVSYTGQLRWGKEEAFWTDHFNAGKKDNDYLDFLTRDQIDDLREERSNRWGKWENWNISWGDDDDRYLHQFVCQFGEMKGIEITGRSRALVTLQNGDKIKVSGEGYNDIGAKIRVMDNELGMVSVNWSQIDNIQFKATPKSIGSKMGEPLFGEVETISGKFTGYIQWDHDERLSEDKLDGDTDDGDLSIPFGNVKSIVNRGSSVSLTMNSGRKFTLRGSNDVNRSNRGIIVTMEDGVRVDIPWSEFDAVTFLDKPTFATKYADFKNQAPLTGSVKAENGTMTGDIVYDLDEAFNYEIIQGKNDDIEYLVPLRSIQQIVPKNYDNSYVVLRNGQKLLLGDAQDVSDRHDGILVFKNADNAAYIPWDEVDEVNFK